MGKRKQARYAGERLLSRGIARDLPRITVFGAVGAAQDVRIRLRAHQRRFHRHLSPPRREDRRRRSAGRCPTCARAARASARSPFRSAPEVRRPGRRGLPGNVVRLHAGAHQAAEELLQGVRVVIDAVRSTAWFRTGPARRGAASAGELGGDLTGLVGVDHRPDGPEPAEHRREPLRHAGGKDHGHARADPHDVLRVDLPEAPDDPFQLLVGEHEWITAGEEDLLDGGSLRQVFAGVLQLADRSACRRRER